MVFEIFYNFYPFFNLLKYYFHNFDVSGIKYFYIKMLQMIWIVHISRYFFSYILIKFVNHYLIMNTRRSSVNETTTMLERLDNRLFPNDLCYIKLAIIDYCIEKTSSKKTSILAFSCLKKFFLISSFRIELGFAWPFPTLALQRLQWKAIMIVSNFNSETLINLTKELRKQETTRLFVKWSSRKTKPFRSSQQNKKFRHLLQLQKSKQLPLLLQRNRLLKSMSNLKMTHQKRRSLNQRLFRYEWLLSDRFISHMSLRPPSFCSYTDRRREKQNKQEKSCKNQQPWTKHMPLQNPSLTMISEEQDSVLNQLR